MWWYLSLAGFTYLRTVSHGSGTIFPGLPTMAPEWQICAMVDIDGDGQNDLVLPNVRTGERRIWVLALQSGQLSVNRAIELPTFYAGWRFAGAGYFTLDGKPNLLLQNSLTVNACCGRWEWTAASCVRRVCPRCQWSGPLRAPRRIARLVPVCMISPATVRATSW
jgi:hypothetical protein